MSSWATRIPRAAIPVAALVALSGVAWGQTGFGQLLGQDPPPGTQVFEYRIPVAGPRLGQTPPPPLSPALARSVQRGRALAEAGQLDAARDTLSAALARSPHHPQILVELASVHAERRAWRAIEQMARSERTLARDSLLLAEDLATALRRLGKPRDATQVVLEAWVASSGFYPWARAELDSLLPADPKGTREAVRRVATAHPWRLDLIRESAWLDWNAGDPQSALRLLNATDDTYKGAPLRWAFAEELLGNSASRDSAWATEVLMDLAGDRDRDLPYRLAAAHRVWEVYSRRGRKPEGALRVARSIEDVPVERWGQPFTIELIRGLREGGSTEDARRLLRDLGDQGQAVPEIAIERALNDLRDGPPARALETLRGLAATSDEAGFHYAQALFFAGQPDSALAWYGRVTHDPASPWTGAALERIYLIEDAEPKEALPLFGRLAYERWRKEQKHALALADSLYRSVPRGSLWAQAAIELASLREESGDGRLALEPLLAVADGLPEDRLAPLARQRAGDAYRLWLRDEAKALQQYEECLARYPKAWNAPEVRRWVETLRRERRF